MDIQDFGSKCTQSTFKGQRIFQQRFETPHFNT